jgi:hypothetical protein
MNTQTIAPNRNLRVVAIVERTVVTHKTPWWSITPKKARAASLTICFCAAVGGAAYAIAYGISIGAESPLAKTRELVAVSYAIGYGTPNGLETPPVETHGPVAINNDNLSENGDNLTNKGNNTVPPRPVVSDTRAVQPLGAAKSAVSRKPSSHLRSPKTISNRVMPVRVERFELCSVGCEIRGPLVGRYSWSLLSKIRSAIAGQRA